MSVTLNNQIMRKILFSVAALFTFGAMSAQEGGFSLGLHAGIPTGDSYSANFGVDVAYMWPVGEGFKVGVASGYTNYSGKDFDSFRIDEQMGIVSVKEKGVNAGFIPLAGAARYSLTENFFIAADLGYVFYTGRDGGTLSSVNLGAAYKF